MRLAVTFFFFFVAFGGYAQSGRQHRPLYQIGNKFNNGGWHFAPGITYMYPAAHSRAEARLVPAEPEPETVFDGTFNAAGRLGFYLEVGKQYFFDEPLFFHYIDFGLHYKHLSGSEAFTGQVRTDAGMLGVENSGRFSDGFIGAYFNANHIFQVSDHSFIQLGVGVNADYRLFERRQFEGESSPFGHEFADPFQGQLHAKIGFGFKPELGVLIIPSIETPILNVVPMYDGKSTLPYYSSRYRPIIVSVRVLLFGQNRAGDCVGKSSGEQKHDLWDPAMQRQVNKKKKKKKKKK